MRRLAAGAALALCLTGCPQPLLPLAPDVPEATPSQRPSPTPTPSETPGPTRWRTAALVGWLYGKDGRPATGALTIHVRSGALAATPFEATGAVSNGTYGLTGVPSRIELKVEVLRDDVPVQTRTVRFLGTEPEPAVVSFGGPGAPEDPDAPLYPIP